MNDEKVCPLSFAGTDDVETKCMPGRCAWALDGQCAMRVVAASLVSISNDMAEISRNGINIQN